MKHIITFSFGWIKPNGAVLYRHPLIITEDQQQPQQHASRRTPCCHQTQFTCAGAQRVRWASTREGWLSTLLHAQACCCSKCRRGM
jgi:hypothetical protein